MSIRIYIILGILHSLGWFTLFFNLSKLKLSLSHLLNSVEVIVRFIHETHSDFYFPRMQGNEAVSLVFKRNRSLYVLWLLVRQKETGNESLWSTITLESITLCEFCWQQSFQIFLLMGGYYLGSNNLMTDIASILVHTGGISLSYLESREEEMNHAVH